VTDISLERFRTQLELESTANTDMLRCLEHSCTPERGSQWRDQSAGRTRREDQQENSAAVKSQHQAGEPSSSWRCLDLEQDNSKQIIAKKNAPLAEANVSTDGEKGSSLGACETVTEPVKIVRRDGLS
jgi:hypothetical protein